MVNILKKLLDDGLTISGIAENCPSSHHCFWGKRNELFMAGKVLPKGCPKDNCLVVILRKTVEADSPAYYGEAWKLSKYGTLPNVNQPLGKKRRKRVAKVANDVRKFTQIVILIIRPLLLTHGQMPFLKTQEIEELRGRFVKEEIEQTIAQMKRMNPEWLEWINTMLDDLFYQYAYSWAVVWLVHLFLRGMEKYQLPNIKKMSKEDKDKFFAEIEKGISRK